jgi:hypothetical protein
MFVTKQTKPIHSNAKQVYVNSVGCLYMYVICVYFGLYLGHHQTCRYKNLTKEGTINIRRRLAYVYRKAVGLNETPLTCHISCLFYNAVRYEENTTWAISNVVHIVLRNKSKSGGLSPPDFDLFPKLKKPLRGKRFRSIEEVSNEVT